MKKITTNYIIIGMQLFLVGFFFVYQIVFDKTEENKITVSNDNIYKTSVLVANLFKDNNEINKEEETADENIETPLASVEENISNSNDTENKTENLVNNEEEVVPANIFIDTSKYLIDVVKGFNVTTNNKTYSLSDEEFNIVAGVIGCEAVNLNDALAVASVILNRADKRGQNPIQVVSAYGQFSCYNHQSVKSYSVEALTDALNGIRNNNYNSFNGWYSTVSDNYIIEGGNRFY